MGKLNPELEYSILGLRDFEFKDQDSMLTIQLQSSSYNHYSLGFPHLAAENSPERLRGCQRSQGKQKWRSRDFHRFRERHTDRQADPDRDRQSLLYLRMVISQLGYIPSPRVNTVR